MTYADSSVLVAFYVREGHSPAVIAAMPSAAPIWLTSFHRAEWFSAVFAHVRRRDMSPLQLELVIRAFELDRGHGLWMDVPFPDGAWDGAIDLTRQHGARLPIRTLDTLHVAAALELGAERFWTLDRRQAALAAAAGLDLV